MGYVADEPFVVSLWKYRKERDRVPVGPGEGNLVSSEVAGRPGRHGPVIDLDFPHRYVGSSTAGHGHLYLDVETSRWRMLVLLVGLRLTGNIERGFFWWSVRRGATFVRPEGVRKVEG